MSITFRIAEMTPVTLTPPSGAAVLRNGCRDDPSRSAKDRGIKQIHTPKLERKIKFVCVCKHTDSVERARYTERHTHTRNDPQEDEDEEDDLHARVGSDDEDVE